MKFRPTLIAAALAVVGTLGLSSAQAGTVIFNTGSAATATVALGVNDDGSLNTTTGSVTVNAGGNTGLAFKMTPTGGATGFYDATAPGCLCEGWGVSGQVGATTYSGGANQASYGSGASGLTFGAATNVTGSTVTTLASLSSLAGLSVKQEYQVASATTALFRNRVTITNDTAAAIDNVKYVRVMDWDVPFTEFAEYVTIKGTATTTLLEFSNDNGFCASNPTAGCSAILGGTTNTDFTDSGPADHGAYFRFNFGTIAAGSSYSFDIFYGAADSEAGAIAAISAEGLELYSLGQSSGGERTGAPATFIFGFAGVGGTPVEGVPEPGSLALAGLALAGLGLSRRARRQA
jgi:PEP-CTERM motif